MSKNAQSLACRCIFCMRTTHTHTQNVNQSIHLVRTSIISCPWWIRNGGHRLQMSIQITIHCCTQWTNMQKCNSVLRQLLFRLSNQIFAYCSVAFVWWENSPSAWFRTRIGKSSWYWKEELEITQCLKFRLCHIPDIIGIQGVLNSTIPRDSKLCCTNSQTYFKVYFVGSLASGKRFWWKGTSMFSNVSLFISQFVLLFLSSTVTLPLWNYLGSWTHINCQASNPYCSNWSSFQSQEKIYHNSMQV